MDYTKQIADDLQAIRRGARRVIAYCIAFIIIAVIIAWIVFRSNHESAEVDKVLDHAQRVLDDSP